MEAHDFISGGAHQPIRFFRRFIQLSCRGLNYEDYFSFGFVRNPYDRFMSAMTAHYMGQGSQKLHDHIFPFTKQGFLDAIHHNIENYGQSLLLPKKEPPGEDVHFLPQYKFLCIYKPEDLALSWEGKIEVNFVGRFENIQEDWAKVCQQIGVAQEPLQHIRKNDFQDYSSLWSDETRELVYNIYKKDFEVFGYER